MFRLRTFALLVLAGLIVIPAGQSSAQVKYREATRPKPSRRNGVRGRLA